MRYEMMLPHQIRRAIAENWPVVLPLGVLEYHGEHMAVGMDTIAVIDALSDIEREVDLVMLPPFYYGAASYAVEPPEGNGSLQVNADQLKPFAQEMFMGLLRIGFRNIHFFIHHQSENFAAGCRPIWLSSWRRGRRSSPSSSGNRGGMVGPRRHVGLLRPPRGPKRSLQLDFRPPLDAS